ncbi:IclR family transcriptional regulator [Sphingomonas sp.]|uniref:IclR family transcriptional regulator n=1 Tax=Sphingomonas sp. TaxID=28214 RepID=UPI002DD67EB5|nr:helix-turn-helix domain-containing protein [Sphingomonas sp.]
MERRAVKSASRTLEVLELFSEQRRPLRLNDIYTALGYPQSSATNLLKSMVMLGYLNYNRATRTYLPTIRVTVLGNWLLGFIHGQGNYRRLVDQLHRETDETVALVTQNDLFIQYIMMRVPTHEHKMPPNEGAMRLMLDSSSGIALLSQVSDREIDKICRYTNYYELAPGGRINLEDVMREVNWARHTGYCYVPNRPTPEVSSLSFPLGEQLHGIPLAIGVGGMAERISLKKSAIVATIRRLIDQFKEHTGPFADLAGPATREPLSRE